MQIQDKEFLLEAIKQAKESIKQGGFPAGTIMVKDNKIISRGISIGNIIHDPTSHGEVNAIREACKKINSVDLSGVSVYSSLEPCMMCLTALMWANVSRVFYACNKSKVSVEYYGGEYKTSDINKSFLRKIEIIPVTELEPSSLEVVSEWEKNISKK